MAFSLSASDQACLLQVPRVAEGVVRVDGVVDKREWYNASQLPFLHGLDKWGRINAGARAYLCHDDQHLHVGFRIARPKHYGRPKVVLTKENAHLGEAAYGLSGKEDRVRVVIKLPSGKRIDLTGNAASIFRTKVDGKLADLPAVFQSRATGDRWEGEARIPLAELGNARAFLFDFVNLQSTPEEKVEALAYRRSLDEDENLWRVELVRDALTVKIRTEQWGHVYERALWFQCRNDSERAAPVTLTYAAAKRTETSARLTQTVQALAKLQPETQRATAAPGDRTVQCIRLPDDVGEYALIYQIATGATTACRGVLFVDVETPLQVDLTPYFLKYKKLRSTAHLQDVAGLSKNTTVVFTLADSAGHVYDRQSAKVAPDDNDVSVYLSTERLEEEAKYKLRAQVVDKGKRLAERAVAFVRPKNPAWWDKGLGLSMEVPPPFEPLRVKGHTIGLWKRRYDFDGKLLPQRITSRGTELLAAPIRVLASAAGQPVDWSGGKLTLRTSTPGKAAFTYEARGRQLKLNADVLCEFDGMIRYDLTLSPVHTSAAVDRLCLEIPVKKAYADLYAYGYLYTDLEKAKGHDNKGVGLSFGRLERYFERHPNGRMPFCAAFYLGSDDRGIQWFAENDRDWANANEDEVIELERREDRTVLRINLIDKATVVQRPLKFTWGIITTPIRDTSWERRNFKAAAGDIRAFLPGGDKHRLHVEKYFECCAKQGMKYIGAYHQMKGQFGAPRCFTEEETGAFRAFGRYLDGLGLSYYYYSGWGVTANIPHSEMFSREMFAEPLKSVGYGTYAFNLNSPYLDYYLDGMRYMVQEAGAAGAHLDSTYIFFRILANELDGYRFVKNGRVHGSWPIFAMRAFARRLYTMLNSGEISDRRGVVHAGYSYPLYCVGGFVTVRGAWEDYYHRKKLKDIPLDYFRLRSADIGNGVYARFSWANWLKLPIYANEVMTIALLHGLRTGIGGEIAYTPRYKDPYDQKWNPQGLINILFDEFDAAGAEFHPYYRSEPFIKRVVPSHVLSSVYLHPGERAIVILGNIEDQEVVAKVEFNWSRFGLAGRHIEVRDGLLPDTPFAPDHGVYSIPIRSQRYRIVTVRKTP